MKKSVRLGIVLTLRMCQKVLVLRGKTLFFCSTVLKDKVKSIDLKKLIYL